MARSAFARAFMRALSYRWRFSALAVLFALLVALPCAASEIVLQHDSLPPANAQQLEAPRRMRLGVWFDAPVDGTLVGVQIVWASASGNAAPSQQVAIRVSPYNPAMTTSGSAWATIDSPVLTDSGVNEFRYLDPSTNLQPLAVPVTVGQSFLVDLEFNEQQEGDASILMDADGASGYERSLINFLSGSNWGDLGIGVLDHGDLGIRAIIQPVPEPPSMILLSAGAIGLAIAARRQRKHACPS